jgi:hypothetical protein
MLTLFLNYLDPLNFYGSSKNRPWIFPAAINTIGNPIFRGEYPVAILAVVD